MSTTAEQLRIRYQWIKEGLASGEISHSLTHDTTLTDCFAHASVDARYEQFLRLFHHPLSEALLTHKEGEVSYKRRMASGDICTRCGRLVSYSFDGITLRDGIGRANRVDLDDTPCEIATPFEFEVVFPTGHLLCKDAIPYARELFAPRHEEVENLGLPSQQKKLTLGYAGEGWLHVFVGNTCPSVFLKDDTLVIGKASDNEMMPCACGVEGCDCDYETYPPLDSSKEIATICTDLWWATLVDASVYQQQLINHYGPEEGVARFQAINCQVEAHVKPGRYRNKNFINFY